MTRETKPMRSAVTKAVYDLMKEDNDVYFVTADLGGQMPELFEFQDEQRFLDVGISEQDMIAISSGLAYSGKTVFTSTLACFASVKAAEPIRVDLCYPNLNVNMFGQGRGLCYGFLGATHHATEDIGVLRAIANMTILLPADPMEAVKMVKAAAKSEGPTYIGLPRGEEPVVYEEDYDFEIGKAVTMTEGDDVTIIATGTMVVKALDAAELLAKEGIKARVLNMHTVKPLDEKAVLKAAEETGCIVTAEDHNIMTGLGSAVAEVIVEANPIPMKRIGVPDIFCSVGDFEELVEKYHMTPADIAQAARGVINRKK